MSATLPHGAGSATKSKNPRFSGKTTAFNLFAAAGLALAIFGAYNVQPQLIAAAQSLDGGPVTAATIGTLSLFGAAIMTAIALLPVLSFVRRGWGIKRADVLSSFEADAISLYVKTFLPNNKSASSEKIFCDMYDHRYGLYRLNMPVLLLAATLFPLSLLVARSALVKIAGPAAGSGTLVLPGQALAAVTGAYAFVVAGLVRGALTYNLPPVTLVNTALRLLVAAPLGYAVAIFGAGKSEFLAFAIGAFPLDQFATYFRRWAGQLINQGLTNPVTDDSADQALALDGIDQPMSESLANCQITTVLQLAYCDPVQLSLGTNIDFDVIADLQSEALAYLYFGAGLAAIRPLGLRGAVEIANLLDLEAKDPDAFNQAFTAAKTALSLTDGGLRNSFREIAADPYTKFLVAIWRGRKT